MAWNTLEWARRMTAWADSASGDRVCNLAALIWLSGNLDNHDSDNRHSVTQLWLGPEKVFIKYGISLRVCNSVVS
jgi:hypothetical protein